MLHDITQEQKNLYLLLLQLLFLPKIILYVQKSIDSELLIVDIIKDLYNQVLERKIQ